MLWSSSWVLIKKTHLPPLPFAGVRYVLASLLLLPLALTPVHRARLRRMTRAEWVGVAGLGISMYTVAQGAQFAALSLLPATSVSLILNLSAPLVALAGLVVLQERPTTRQWLGLAVCALGVATFFWGRVSLVGAAASGLAVAALCTAANVAAALLGRRVNGQGDLPPILVTVLSMGIGACLLLAAGTALQGVLRPTRHEWIILLWLIVVNTAFAFTAWNTALRVLSAMESSVIANTMLAQIALAAWLFLGERITVQSLVGIGLTVAGTLLVQLRPRSVR
jgi:drug/metabolite transporter (DMT)-like permease